MTDHDQVLGPQPLGTTSVSKIKTRHIENIRIRFLQTVIDVNNTMSNGYPLSNFLYRWYKTSRRVVVHLFDESKDDQEVENLDPTGKLNETGYLTPSSLLHVQDL